MRINNFSHSSDRTVVERAIGVVKRRWHCLHTQCLFCIRQCMQGYYSVLCFITLLETERGDSITLWQWHWPWPRLGSSDADSKVDEPNPVNNSLCQNGPVMLPETQARVVNNPTTPSQTDPYCYWGIHRSETEKTTIIVDEKVSNNTWWWINMHQELWSKAWVDLPLLSNSLKRN